MGKRGFAKQPEAIAKKKGTFRKDRYINSTVNITGIEYLDHVPDPPEFLNEEGVKYWNTSLSQLIQIKNLIAKVDLYLFADLCYNYQLIIECNLKMDELRHSIAPIRKNPYQSIHDKSFRAYIKLCREFGLTPASRVKFNLENHERLQ